MNKLKRLANRLTISQKIMLGFVTMLLISIFIGVRSYSELSTVQKKLELIELGDDSHRLIMEIRRDELMYFECGDISGLNRVITNTEKARGLLQNKIPPLLNNFHGQGHVDILIRDIEHHEKIALALKQSLTENDREQVGLLNTRLDASGVTLLAHSRQLSQFERNRVNTILAGLKRYNIWVFSLLIGVAALLIPIVSLKIVSPLRRIQMATREFVSGDFKPLHVSQSRDETRDVILAFNSMIEELDKQQDIIIQSEKLSSLGAFTSGIAHELNNPLNNISTSCQIILSEFETIERDFNIKLLTNIEREVDRARDIVKGLLDFARDKEFTLEDVDLGQIIESTLGLIRNDMPDSITLTTSIPQPLTIRADFQKLQQVILNIVLNAMQAISGDGSITISAHHGTEPNRAIIQISDTGPGIPEDVITNIFDPFFTTKGAQGTGLGLSIVFGIVEKHNGAIHAENLPQGGTLFTIELPGNETSS